MKYKISSEESARIKKLVQSELINDEYVKNIDW